MRIITTESGNFHAMTYTFRPNAVRQKPPVDFVGDALRDSNLPYHLLVNSSLLTCRSEFIPSTIQIDH